MLRTCTASVDSLLGRSTSSLAECVSRGRTEAKMVTAINREQAGSAMKRPKRSMRTEETITLTLPRVSARM